MNQIHGDEKAEKYKVNGISPVLRRGRTLSSARSMSGTSGSIESLQKPSIVLATDWGADGAQTNVELLMRRLVRSFGREIDVLTIPGIPPLASPLGVANEFDRILTTSVLTAQATIRTLERRGKNPGSIQSTITPLILVNVFDLSVGSERIPVLVEGKIKIHGQMGDYELKVCLVGPANNGIIGTLIGRLDDVTAVSLSNPDLQLDKAGCATWDGRAVFGPAAAFYASGTPASEFGNRLDAAIFPKIVWGATNRHLFFETQLLDIDAIGNLVLGVRNNQWRWSAGAVVRITIQNSRSLDARIGEKFADVAPGQGVLYPGSKGLWECAINGGSAATILDLSRSKGDLDLVQLNDGNLSPKTLIEVGLCVESKIGLSILSVAP